MHYPEHWERKLALQQQAEEYRHQQESLPSITFIDSDDDTWEWRVWFRDDPGLDIPDESALRAQMLSEGWEGTFRAWLSSKIGLIHSMQATSLLNFEERVARPAHVISFAEAHRRAREDRRRRRSAWARGRKTASAPY